MKLLQIENKSGKIRLNEAVTKPSIERMIDEIGKLFGATAAASGANFGEIMNCAENAIDTLEIEINSQGGSVFDGYTIFNEIQSLRERGVVVTATITGMAASMASVIAMACNTIRMAGHARMMIHDASNVVGGNAAQLRKAADLLDGISEDIAGIYAVRTGKPVDEIRVMMKKETWMNADEAIANGFADEVMSNKAKAEFDTTGKSMSIFARLFPDNADAVAKLDAMLDENATLSADLESAQARIGELAPLAEVNATLQAELTASQASIEAAATQAAEAAAKIAELEANAGKLDDLAAIKASELLAAQGHPAPVSLVGDNGEAGGNTKTRSEISNLKPAEVKAFIKAGGKITD